ncbi:glycosyltransferase family 39 protein [Psychrobacter aestuarii]|uniref:UDP-phosphomannose--protein mannosyltransferase n=1 Tax=Psychrobacter aestuarii TaxID=556327 RepID=A0ABP3FNY0_9GAMM|nr:glycosyltransferase family 39 protein [Psychrobacter aestuarii]
MTVKHTPDHPTRTPYLWFVLCLIAYFVLWSILPAFLASSVALDVSEGINWGSEWQWGYYKHPPLSSWILYSFYQLFGHIGPYVLSQLCVLLTLYLVYRLGKTVFNQATAILGSVLTLAVVYYVYPSLEFNHNVAQFPIWAGLSLAFYHCITRERIGDWLWLGVLGGLGMLTKYSVAFLLIPMALYLLLPSQWHHLKRVGPWAALALMVALFVPHVYWLATHDWLPFGYASGRSHDVAEGADTLSRHTSWLGFFVAQLVAHIPLLILAFINRKSLFKPNAYREQLTSAKSNIKLLWYIWAAPLALLVVLSLIFGIGLRDMWGMPMWALSGLLVASFIKPEYFAIANKRMQRRLIVWLSIATVLSMVYVGAGDYLRHKPSRMQWPEQAIADNAAQTWQDYSSCPLDSVSGDRWLGALIAMNNDFPSQMISGPASHSPWMTAERLRTHGTLVVKEADAEVELPLLDQVVNKGDFIKHQGQWQIAWRDAEIAPLIIDWTLYVPKNCQTAQDAL